MAEKKCKNFESNHFSFKCCSLCLMAKQLYVNSDEKQILLSIKKTNQLIPKNILWLRVPTINAWRPGKKIPYYEQILMTKKSSTHLQILHTGHSGKCQN